MTQPVFLIQGFRSNQMVFGLRVSRYPGAADPVSRTGDLRFRAADFELLPAGPRREASPLFSGIFHMRGNPFSAPTAGQHELN